MSGRRVPDDVSVVGFDDMPEAEFMAPPLTTVRQDYELAAKAALNMLVGIVEGRRPSVRHVEIGNTLIVRSSTAPPAPTPRTTSTGPVSPRRRRPERAAKDVQLSQPF